MFNEANASIRSATQILEFIVVSKQSVARMRERLGMALRAGERWAIRAPLTFSFAAVLVLLAVTWGLFRPSYDTNDDVFISMIAAGQGFCPAPDEHLIFTNVLVGHALKRLYTAWPQVPWYGLYLLTIHYFAQVTLLFLAITSGRRLAEQAGDNAESFPRLRLGLYLANFAIVELLMLNNMQFTTTAFLAAQTGVVLLWLAWQRRAGDATANVNRRLAAAVAFLLIAALVRPESLAMTLLAGSPLAISISWRQWRGAIMPCGSAVAIAVGLIVLAATIDRAAYDNDSRWSGFFSYNALRVKFNDYRWTRFTPGTAHAFLDSGWSKNDHDMIANWFFDDAELYREDRLRSVLDSYPWKSDRLSEDYFWQTYRGLGRNRSVWATLLALPFFVAAIDRRTAGRRTVVLCGLVSVVMVVALTLNTKALPLRVYFPLLSFPLCVAVLMSDLRAGGDSMLAWLKLRESPRVAPVVMLLLVVGLVMAVHHQACRSVRVQKDRRAMANLIAELRPDGHTLIVCWEAAMPFELLSPLDNLQSWSKMPLVNLTWTQRTVWQDDIKRRFKIDDLARAMADREDVLLVATPAHRALFANYAWEHFGVELDFVERSRAGEKVAIGRFQRIAGDASLSRNNDAIVH